MSEYGLTESEVSEFASVFSSVSGANFLWQAGFPDAMTPSIALNAGDFWAEVSRKLRNGAFPDGRRKLIAAAYRRYPANDAFAGGRLRRVLLVGASPDEGDTVRADRELREIQNAARLGHLEVASVLAAQVSDLRIISREKPDIVHLSTHADGESLYFESPIGEPQRTAADEVVATLAEYRDTSGVKLSGVVLSSCHGEGIAGSFLAIADSVVAFRGLLDDACAVLLTRRIYEELRETPDLTKAARHAAQDLSREGDCAADSELITLPSLDCRTTPAASAAAANRPSGREAPDSALPRDMVRQSHEVPVLVEFWAESSELCRRFDRVLERLAGESTGAWKLAKIDVEASPQLAAVLKVQTIPTVAAMIQGQIIDEFSGIPTELDLRQWIRQKLEIGRHFRR